MFFSKVIRTIAWLMCVVSLIIGAVLFREFYTVIFSANKEIFPGEQGILWYYRTRETYTAYSLISGLLFSVAGLITLHGLLKRDGKRLFFGVAMVLVLIFFFSISAVIR